MQEDQLKQCCSKIYENDFLSVVLGDVLHPGGKKLTLHLGKNLDINKNSLVLDVACGRGLTALTLTQYFGCQVIGVDLSKKNLLKAKEKASTLDISYQPSFIRTDAEFLAFNENLFDVIISECSLCLFPDKKRVMNELFRVTKQNGMIGITDITVNERLPEKLQNVLSYVFCIAGALSQEEYELLLREVGFSEISSEDHSSALLDLIQQVKVIVSQLDLSQLFNLFDIEHKLGVSFNEGQQMFEQVISLIEKGSIKYSLITGIKTKS